MDNAETKVLESLASVITSPDGALCTFIQHKKFWPIAIKGGYENTLRDVMLYDLGDCLKRYHLICTGERNYGDEGKRADIAVYGKDAIAKGLPLPRPAVVIELKHNFRTQLPVDKKRCWEKLRAVEAVREGNENNIPVIGIQFLSEISEANAESSLFSKRYQSDMKLKKIHDVALANRYFCENFPDEEIKIYRSMNFTLTSDDHKENGVMHTLIIHKNSKIDPIS